MIFYYFYFSAELGWKDYLSVNEGQAYMWRAWSSIYSILFYISSYFIFAREKMNVLFCFAAVFFISFVV